jgi:hypothetical protein
MTLSELLAGTYEEALYATSPPTAVTTRLTRFLNEGIRIVLSQPGMSRLADSDSPLTVSSVASQARYVVPEAVAQIRGMTERTNDHPLTAMSLTEYRRIEPDPAANSGTPEQYVPIGKVAVAVQPSNASAIFIKSTSASDVGTAYIEGLITGGYRRTASVVMTGVTAVQIDSTLSTFIEIEDVYLSANAVGTITVHEDSGSGTELARITIGQKRPRYYGFYLWPTPSGAIDYLVDYRRELLDLVQVTDEPPLPLDYHHMLMAYAVAREYEVKGDTARVVIALKRFTDTLNRLKYETQTNAQELPVSNHRRLIGHSRLGGMFPADTWTRG